MRITRVDAHASYVRIVGGRRDLRMAHLVDGNGRRGGRGVLHCDTTLWRTIEMGRLDSVSDSLLAIGDGPDGCDIR
jgi:hypothetical protein